MRDAHVSIFEPVFNYGQNEDGPSGCELDSVNESSGLTREAIALTAQEVPNMNSLE